MSTNRSTEYYNLEKVAEVLSVSTAEVNRLREQNKLRGFRDGSNWKFSKEDVHTYLAASIKARSGNDSGVKTGDSDFDLAEDNASASSFDLLMEDAVLPGDDQLISAAPVQSKSDLDLAALDDDSDLALAEETQISSLVVPKKAKSPEKKKDELESSGLEVDMDEDSSALVLGSVEHDESVLSANGSSPQLGLAGDSGFDVFVAGEGDGESEILLVDEATSIPMLSAADFTLEPAPKVQGDDDSESSSQVIAIDVGLEGAGLDTDPFGGNSFGDFTDFGSGIQSPPATPAAPASHDPFGSGTIPSPDAFVTPKPTVSSKRAVAPEEEYSTGMLIALVSALVVMLLPGIMLLDTMVHMWSWDERFDLTSWLMSGIASTVFGL